MIPITTNFTLEEFACKGMDCCNNSAPMSPRLVSALQVLRDRAGKPLVITSGYRCNKHNLAVGGKPHSQHTQGMAADIAAPPGMTPKKLLKLARDTKLFEGLRLREDGIHIDVGCQAPGPGSLWQPAVALAAGRFHKTNIDIR